jgi:hypothetical protein
MESCDQTPVVKVSPPTHIAYHGLVQHACQILKQQPQSPLRSLHHPHRRSFLRFIESGNINPTQSTPEQHPGNIKYINRIILIGCMTMGFSIMSGTNLKILGACISITGGIISMIAAFGQIFGLWDWAEYRLKQEREKDLDRLGRVMGVLRVKGGSEEVISMAKEQVEEIRLETAYGILVTKRKNAGGCFVVSFEKEKGETVEADLVRAIDLKGDQEWVNKARGVVIGEQWEYLLSLYP